MKRFISFILLIFITLSLVSCKEWKPYDLQECESGYFRYHIYKPNSSDEYYIYLVGLTELGLQQKELIIPKYIDGLKVYNLGYERALGGKLPGLGGMLAGQEKVLFEAGENLEKMYFQEEDFDGNAGFFFVNAKHTYFVQWHDFYDTFDIKGVIVGFNLYVKYMIEPREGKKLKIANVSYMYNYEESPNDGYYWVDSYDKDIITFIPPVPTREGYIFEGWYEEEECINKWDFNSDKTGEEIIITEKEQYSEYLGTYLYANWIKE